MRRRRIGLLALVAVLGSILPGLAAESEFPFDHELILDASPMRGSKRIPILQIEENGATSIDLWCASLSGQTKVAADKIAIVPAPAPVPTVITAAPAAVPDPAAPGQCPADRAQRDEELLSALTQVTSWRRNGDLVELLGAKTLRFRLMTN
jgi:hypothetical protein